MDLLQNKRILIIEDDTVNMAIISSLLRRYGAIVFEINPKFQQIWTFPDDYRLKQGLPIDLILTDLMFPNMTGYDIFAMLRTITDLQHVPIVAVSAHYTAQEMEKARQIGFAGFIGKPLQLATFGRYVAELLEGNAIWGASD
jgi:two-component system cell cycle response regulator DivK